MRSIPGLFWCRRGPGCGTSTIWSKSTLALVTGEITRASKALQLLLTPVKLNVAALGKMVPQLHIHVIARFANDAAWPKPVWGVRPAEPYDQAALTARIRDLRGAFSQI